MKLVVFLGNPGLKYRKTRHNVGFMIGDTYAKKLGLKWKKEVKFGAEIARDGDALLAKPQLFYNLTGESVQKIMSFYKIDKSDLLVVCDDLNLDFGKIRHRAEGSDGGNNGLKSIIQHLGPNFARIRVGTNNELRAVIGDTDFVLSKFSKEEQQQLPQIFAAVIWLTDYHFGSHRFIALCRLKIMGTRLICRLLDTSFPQL